MKNFLDFAEDRLIVLDQHGNIQKEWMEDWMRAFKGNPSEFQPPILPLESLTAQQRGFLKQVLDDPDPGDFWKLDDPPWNLIDPTSPHWERYRIRGIIAELDLYHQQYRADGFIHTPTAPAIDYIKDIAVQAKSVKNPMGAASDLKIAIDDLYIARPTGPLRLEVLVKPGVDWSDLDAALEAYVRDFFTEAERARLEILIDNYIVVP